MSRERPDAVASAAVCDEHSRQAHAGEIAARCRWNGVKPSVVAMFVTMLQRCTHAYNAQ